MHMRIVSILQKLILSNRIPLRSVKQAVTRSRQRFEVAQFLDRLKEGSKHWITKENIDTRITAKMFEGDVMASPASLAEVGETDIS